MKTKSTSRISARAAAPLALAALLSTSFASAPQAEACCKWFSDAVNAVRDVGSSAVDWAKARAEEAARKAREAAEAVRRAATSAAAEARRVAERAAAEATRLADEASSRASKLATAAAERARNLARTVGDAVKENLRKGFNAVADAAASAWNAIAQGLRWLAERAVEIAAKTVAAVLKPIIARIERGLDDARYAFDSRRAPVPACFSLDGNVVQSAIKSAMTGALVATFTNAVKNSWAQLSAAGQMGAASGLGQQSTLASSAAHQSAEDAIASSAKAMLGKMGVSMLVNAALHAATFPVGYFSSHFACTTYKQRCDKNAYVACYEREWLGYTKNWLFDGFVTTALAALDPPIMVPLALEVGATVSTAVAAGIAALTGGTGAIAAPAIGAIAAFVTKVGISVLLQRLIKARFFGLYERTTWAAAEGAFRNTIKRDHAPDSFWSVAPKASCPSAPPASNAQVGGLERLAQSYANEAARRVESSQSPLYFAARVGACKQRVAYGIIKTTAGECRRMGGGMNGRPSDATVTDCHLDWCSDNGADRYVAQRVGQCGSSKIASASITMTARDCRTMGGRVSGNVTDSTWTACTLDWCRAGSSGGFVAARGGMCERWGYGIVTMTARDCRGAGGGMNGNPADGTWTACHLDWCRNGSEAQTAPPPAPPKPAPPRPAPKPRRRGRGRF